MCEYLCNSTGNDALGGRGTPPLHSVSLTGTSLTIAEETHLHPETNVSMSSLVRYTSILLLISTPVLNRQRIICSISVVCTAVLSIPHVLTHIWYEIRIQIAPFQKSLHAPR